MIEKKQDLLDLVKYFRENQEIMSEDEVGELMKRMLEISPDPNILDYIFYPPGGREMSCEEIVEKAFSYRPIVTPPPSKNTE